MMINSILIANRGEIACRIVRTAKRMGIETVAIYAEPDAAALHVQEADRALSLGGRQPADSYLHAEKIIELAHAAGVDAIHPGYGFLSENADFAQLCVEHDLIFIGPSVDSIKTMGSKSAAKKLMDKADVPLVPGYHGSNQSLERFVDSARECAYPVILKASAGGGGKGMRIVQSEDELETALSAVKRESKSSFGDDHVLLEKYLVEPRHIEIQIFGDSHGNYVHLFERDCSIQRRHQKILEEAPAPGLSDQQREAMGIAAIDAAKAINYVGAGTVEFIADSDGQFFFMEMNTRLQVEHPVTEMITGQDLVEWQIRVAEGQPLPLRQNELVCSGHSIEARIYAENTDIQFLPSSGDISLLSFPPEHQALRVETGVRSGDTISTHYDPMIAKVIAHGASRAEAIHGLYNALDQISLLGLTNNIAFLKRLLVSDGFQSTSLTTSFIENNAAALVSPAIPSDELGLAAVLAAICLTESGIPSTSAWQQHDGWRLNTANATLVSLRALDAGYAPMQEAPYTLTVQKRDQCWRVADLNASWDITGLRVEAIDASHGIWQVFCRLSLNEQIREVNARVLSADKLFSVRLSAPALKQFSDDGRLCRTETLEHRFQVFDQDEPRYDNTDDTGTLLAPMPGKVLSVLTQPGEKVSFEQPLMILEAMKMEHTITAPGAGIVSEVYFQAGDSVDARAQLLAIAPEEES